MNKKQKDLVALICWDLEMIEEKELSEDNKYHLNLALGNLRDFMKELNINMEND
jgi:hypothetical protein